MIFASGLGNPEAPVLLPDGDWLLVEMRPDRGCLTHLSPDGRQRREIARTGRPNGLVRGADGVLWVAESVNPPSLLRVGMDGQVEVVATECNGESFVFPNDLAFGPDGALYMTDTGVPWEVWRGLDEAGRAGEPADGRVYRVDPSTLTVLKLAGGIPFANGIAFGPDRKLYVSATVSGLVYRYLWNDDGLLGEREDFADVRDPERTGFRGPDGIKFGADGRLYCTVSREGDVAVVAPDGCVVRRVLLDGPSPTNLAFGPAGSQTIYVTEQGRGQIEAHFVGSDGLALYAG